MNRLRKCLINTLNDIRKFAAVSPSSAERKECHEAFGAGKTCCLRHRRNHLPFQLDRGTREWTRVGRGFPEEGAARDGGGLSGVAQPAGELRLLHLEGGAHSRALH